VLERIAQPGPAASIVDRVRAVSSQWCGTLVPTRPAGANSVTGSGSSALTWSHAMAPSVYWNPPAVST
jgi:hypothetical protein